MIALTSLLAAQGSLVLQPVQKGQSTFATTRRGVLTSAAGALATFAVATPALAEQSDIAKQLGSGAITKEEYNAALQARKEAERVAALPVNQLKGLRTKLATAEGLIEASNWDGVRDVIQSSTGKNLNDVLKKSDYVKSEKGRILVVKLRKAIYNVDLTAHKQQDFPGAAAFSGYCAEGVIPKNDDGCKVKPAVDKPPLVADLKSSLAAFDELIAL